MVLRHLNQGRDGGLHSNSCCFSSIELLFPILAGDIANVTIAQIPLNPEPPPARNPPPAVIRQKGSACSVTGAGYHCDHLRRAVVTGTVHVDAGFGRLNPHGIESTVSIAHDLLHGKVSCQYRG